MPSTGELDFTQENAYTTYSSSEATASEDEETFIKEIKNDKLSKSFALDKSATFESMSTVKDHGEFFRKCIDLILEEAVFKGTNRVNKVSNWKDPEELQRVFNFRLNDFPSSHEELISLLKDTIKYSVKTGHPYFVNQLFSSLDPYGLIGQWLTDALNPSVYTFEVSPVFTIMEEVVLKEMRKIVGFEDGKGDGIFCPGGSIANGYAISCARYRFQPNIKRFGLFSLPRLALFTSEDAHYSIVKMCSFLGIGSDNVYFIRTNQIGKMDINHLQAEVHRAREDGAQPFMVVATAGTTVLGAFDPLEEIAFVCEREGMWMHVDAAWGGGVLVGGKMRKSVKGIERADSVTWNPHKLLTAPQQCSTLLLKHEGILSEAHSAGAAYLFQKDKFYDTRYDTGDKHIQCGRRADVLKFWFMWKAKGLIGFQRHVEKVFDNAKYFTSCIKSRPGFKMVIKEPEFTNICFWYIPPSLRQLECTDNYRERLHEVAPKIKERMVKKGSMMVSYQTHKQLPNFFRIVFQNSGLNKMDMLHLIEEFEKLGCDL